MIEVSATVFPRADGTGTIDLPAHNLRITRVENEIGSWSFSSKADELDGVDLRGAVVSFRFADGSNKQISGGGLIKSKRQPMFTNVVNLAGVSEFGYLDRRITKTNRSKTLPLFGVIQSLVSEAGTASPRLPPNINNNMAGPVPTNNPTSGPHLFPATNKSTWQEIKQVLDSHFGEAYVLRPVWNESQQKFQFNLKQLSNTEVDFSISDQTVLGGTDNFDYNETAFEVSMRSGDLLETHLSTLAQGVQPSLEIVTSGVGRTSSELFDERHAESGTREFPTRDISLELSPAKGATPFTDIEPGQRVKSIGMTIPEFTRVRRVTLGFGAEPTISLHLYEDVYNTSFAP